MQGLSLDIGMGQGHGLFELDPEAGAPWVESPNPVRSGLVYSGSAAGILRPLLDAFENQKIGRAGGDLNVCSRLPPPTAIKVRRYRA